MTGSERAVIRDAAIEAGRKMVGAAFTGRRRDQTERHLSRNTLAAMLAAAFELGAEWQAEREVRP
jgi:hypothetical protein